MASIGRLTDKTNDQQKMETKNKNINDFLLTGEVTVGQAREWIKTKDENAKENLVKLINHRFQNRYIKHVKKN